MQWLEQRCREQLQVVSEANLLRRRGVCEFQNAREMILGGILFLQFSSNDYLGFATAPSHLQNMAAFGAGASPLVSGYSEDHAVFESAVADYLGFEASLYFNAGFAANEAVLRTCLTQKDVVFSDRLNHASLIDGVRYSDAKNIRYPHLNMDMLEHQLKEVKVPLGGRRWIVTDAVFSMDGHIAPLNDIVFLAQKYEAAVYVDDAHGFGVFGHGRGTVHGLGIDLEKIDVLMVTCGKALGAVGACILGKQVLIDYLVNACRAYIYSTAVPQVMLQVCSARLNRLRNAQRERQNLQQVGLYLYERLSELQTLFGYAIKANTQVLDGFHHPVQPLIIGQAQSVVALDQFLRKEGVYVGAIRPPTVPNGTARLRISLTAQHSVSDVDRLIDIITEFRPRS